MSNNVFVTAAQHPKQYFSQLLWLNTVRIILYTKRSIAVLALHAEYSTVHSRYWFQGTVASCDAINP